MALSGLMWRANDREHPDILGEAYFDSATREYLVVVTRGSERREKRFHALYDPRFGIDYMDLVEIKSAAARLADELREEKPEEH